MAHPDPEPLARSALGDWSEPFMGESLRLAAEALCTFGGFENATIGVVRGDRVVPVAVACAERSPDDDRAPVGVAEALERPLPLDLVQDGLLGRADDWGPLKYLPHDRTDATGFWPGPYADGEPDPRDLLLSPVHDEDGALRGVLAMTATPEDAEWLPARRGLLERYAAQAARVLLTALEHEQLAERQRLAVAARQMLARADGESPEAILADVADDLVAAFQLAGLRARVFEGEAPRLLFEAKSFAGRFETPMLNISARSAEWLWERRLVGLVGRDQVKNWDGPASELAQVLGLIEDLGLESIVLVPLGAGTRCFGALSFFRAAGGPRWTDAECEAAHELGRDLGRLISVRRALQLEQEATQELRALDTYKSRLIATVAHELKNPIAATRAQLDLAAELAGATSGPDTPGDPEEPGLREVLRDTLDAGARGLGRMSRIVDDLLLLAEASDPGTLVVESTDLAPCVTSGVQLVLESFALPATAVRVDLPAEPVVALADARGFEQVVANLVGNAVKYSPAHRGIAVSLTRDGGHAVLRVSDEGIGISAEDLPRLFTEFFRSADPAVRTQQGTGLGLAIVDRFVARLGGRVEVASTPGRGSTFSVVLPAR